jgi:putative hydrolase of the HAD superfamily
MSIVPRDLVAGGPAVVAAREPQPALAPQSQPAGRPAALLLDFGSVISVSVFERHRETERILGLPAGTLTWLGPLAPASDALWQSMLRGEIGEREYWHIRARQTGELIGESGWDMPMLLKRVRQTDPNSVVRPEIDALVFAARAAGIHVGILSNELELFYGSHFLAGMHFLKDLDVIIDATHTGILKPDPRAYQLAIDALRLPPERILFVDDQFRNIAGAVDAGLQTQYFDLRDVPGNIAAVAARLGVSARSCA